VQIEPHEITLAEGQTISLDNTSRLLLDSKATIAVEGEITLPVLPVSVPQSVPGATSSETPVITNFTVFKSVPYNKGDVLTGWKFLTSAQKLPTSQYCYYTEQSDSSPLEPVVFIGEDEKLTRPKQLPGGFDIKAAFNKCVWFNRDIQ